MLKIATSLLFAVLLSGCMEQPTPVMPTNSWFDGFPVATRKEMILTVLPRVGTCSSWEAEDAPCIHVRNEEGDEFGLLKGIVGFDFTPGQTRRILVEFRAYAEDPETELFLPTDINPIEYIYLRDVE